MAEALNVYYAAEHADDPVTVSTPEEVRALLDRVRGAHAAGSAVLLTVIVADDPWKSELCVGVDGDKGVLRFAGEDTPPTGLYSRSPVPSNVEPVIYYYVRADTDFPPHSEVPAAVVEAALIDYLVTSGERPTSVEWQG
ncbi:Imm1 family immunity protein [Actinokineospora sp. G85]|uniref:Imm1 family immunity protein n=1 Tax=Actinokineospora sp. G85 TaxID=3406626 RepID=UPI003C718690